MTYAYAKRPFEIRCKSIHPPYRVFDPRQQRMADTEITENKRLGDMLAFIEMQ
nr:hypothetical protein [Paracoccus saliphilus]